jgi:hypothetical protein
VPNFVTFLSACLNTIRITIVPGDIVSLRQLGHGTSGYPYAPIEAKL